MNRKNLTSAVLAGLAGVAGIAATAQAVNINPDGLGQVLLYPYYTTNGGNSTLLSVVNTTENGKAVKVRFSEGQNTREVLDFNLYLSAYDVWTALVYNNGGTPTMKTTDTTCTVPYIKSFAGSQQAFLNFAMTDGGGTNIARAREGHFEMIEMGTIEGGSATSKYITHVKGVPPSSSSLPKATSRVCGGVIDAWTDPDNTVGGDEGYWLMNPLTDLESPSGGLFGGAAIVDVTDGYMVSYDAKALNGWANELANDSGPLHQQPGFSLPSLNSGDRDDAKVFLDNGEVASAELARNVDAVSYVFMHDTVMNEYITSSGIGARTEWVMTFPTKSFYVYGPVSGDNEGAIAPFTTRWIGNPQTGGGKDPNLVLPCEVVILDGIWNREEQSPVEEVIPGQPIPPIVSPAPPPVDPDVNPIIPFELCYEVSVIRFGSADDAGATTEVLGSSNYHNIDNEQFGFEHGWVKLEMHEYTHDVDQNGVIDGDEELFRNPLAGDGDALVGLPVTGFSVNAYVNAFVANGVLANYGGIFGHKSTRALGSFQSPTVE